MAKAQLILVGLALIAFFATGGIAKAKTAIITAKADFSTVKGKITDFQSEIMATNEAKGKDQITTINSSPFQEKLFISHTPEFLRKEFGQSSGKII